jgi:nucleotide-binding universal stress UspA family protein
MQSVRAARQSVALLEQRTAESLSSGLLAPTVVEFRDNGRAGTRPADRSPGLRGLETRCPAFVEATMTRQNEKVRGSSLLGEASKPDAAITVKPRMLCATDLSQHSLKVAGRAAAIANQLDATLTLLHIVSTEEQGGASGSERIQLRLKSIRSAFRHEPAVCLHGGEYVPTISTVAAEAGADLVVLDSRPWKPILAPIATVSGKLAGLVRRPVLIVKRSSRSAYASVLIAAEQSADFDRVLRSLSSWRLLECDSVAIVHGFEAPYRGPLYVAGFDRHASRRNATEWETAARGRLLQGLELEGVATDHFRIVFAQSRSVREVQREIRKLAPDLLVIATGNHAAVDRVMRASVGNDLLRNIECDILAVPMNPS